MKKALRAGSDDLVFCSSLCILMYTVILKLFCVGSPTVFMLICSFKAVLVWMIKYTKEDSQTVRKYNPSKYMHCKGCVRLEFCHILITSNNCGRFFKNVHQCFFSFYVFIWLCGWFRKSETLINSILLYSI